MHSATKRHMFIMLIIHDFFQTTQGGGSAHELFTGS